MTGTTTGARLLALLRDAGGREVSGGCLARSLGLTRAAVWKQVRALREAGYAIEARPRHGYRLAGSPSVPLPTEVQPLLRTVRFGRTFEYLAATPSTNRDLAGLAARGAPEGSVVVAEMQSAGRGRMERCWASPPGGGLYVSILLRPGIEPSRVTSLPLLIGLCVAQAIEQETGLRPRIKWPNDILLGDRKVCGILCELQAEADRVHHVIAGVGINVNVDASDLPPELAASATSLRAVCGHEVSRPALLAALLNTLEPAYEVWKAQGLTPFLPELASRDALLGREIAVDRASGPIAGRAERIEADGSLSLSLPDGTLEHILSGDAHILRR